MIARMLYLHAITPVHTGTGRSVDVIDLPIAREETTGWPYLPGPTIKGVFREATIPTDKAQLELWERAFGPGVDRASEFAGDLVFPDARIVCLPVRSLWGTFAWVTCPLALQRLKRDCDHLELPFPKISLTLDEANKVAVASASALCQAPRAGPTQREAPGPISRLVVLEDLDLSVVEQSVVAGGEGPVETLAEHLGDAVFPTDKAWAAQLRQRLAVVHDDTFSFLCETATEVTARVRIDPRTRTVAQNALWYEEAVPAEAIFAAPVLCQRAEPETAEKMYALLSTPKVIQVGGNASVGKGLVRVCLTGKKR